MSKPISKRMLVSSATLYTSQTMDEDRNITWGEPVSLSNIWITSTKGQTQGAQGEQTADTMTLYYDCINSIPTAQAFELGQKVTYNGRDYYINSITPCEAFGGLHHYEIGLI